jgi:sulfite exporter TauE/SafE
VSFGVALLASAAALGLASSGHCVTMCGGVMGAVCGGMAPDARRSIARRLGLMLTTSAGRVAAYATFGAIAGGLGGAAEASFPIAGVRLGLRLAAGLLMVALGLRLLGVRWATGWLEGAGSPIFRALRPAIARALPLRSHVTASAVGYAWGWLPCGMVYGAAALALASGGAGAGAATMAVFGLATLPAMLVIGSLATRLAAALGRPWPRRGAGAALVLSGVMSLAFAVVGLSSDAGVAHDVVCVLSR